MNEFVYVIFLAILQGIAEFLPISSSGHLVIGKALLQFLQPGASSQAGGIQLEIVLHLGTLGSILVIFWKDLWQLRSNLRLVLLVILASVPAAVVGLGFKDQLESLFQSPLVAGIGLLVTSAFLMLGQRLADERISERDLSPAGAFVIGCFQAVAIVPGISRSGSTIAGGLIVGLQRSAAATFSFLMAVIAIGGASVLEAKDVILDREPLAHPWWLLLAGAVISFVTGLLALKVLLRVLKGNRIHWFAVYCLIVGTATIVWQTTGK